MRRLIVLSAVIASLLMPAGVAASDTPPPVIGPAIRCEFRPFATVCWTWFPDRTVVTWEYGWGRGEYIIWATP